MKAQTTEERITWLNDRLQELERKRFPSAAEEIAMADIEMELETLEEKQKQDTSNNYGNWFSTLQHLKKIVPKNMTFDEIDENFVKKVQLYFEKDALTKSELPLSQNSKYSYFNKFKAALRNAFDNGYLTINYAAKVKSFEQVESQREYLIFDELQRLAKA